MKLSDKLDASSATDGAGTRTQVRTVRRRGAPARRTPAAEGRQDVWDEAKRTVRSSVLDEVTPRLTGPDAIADDALAAEVEHAVDRALRREDVPVSPVQRRRFFDELRADLLGHGPLE